MGRDSRDPKCIRALKPKRKKFLPFIVADIETVSFNNGYPSALLSIKDII
jgi:hypothetical protein